MTLSVIVITRDEERDLPACLESVRPLAPEIVVLDSGSTDKTREVARRFTDRVYERPFDDFSSQKQAALERATGDWVLSIDADERVTPGLAGEIKEILAGTPDASAYDIPFEVHFMGRRLRFGGLGREHHVRLFKRDKGSFIGPHVHEDIAVDGRVSRLRGRIAHYPYFDLDEYLEKMQVYTTRAARRRYELGRRFHAGYHLLPVWEFFQRTVLRLGLLDGTPGLLWAGLSAFHTWLKYVKLREIESEKAR